MLEDKTILVTGGTGSFGKAFIKECLTNHNPNKLIVYSRDENKQFHLAKELSNSFPGCLLYTSPSPRDGLLSRMPSSA